MRVVLSLDEAREALTQADGCLYDAALKLGVKVHTLNSYVQSHAELQAITHEIRLKTVALSQKVIFRCVENPQVPDETKYPVAKWVLNNADSDNWTPKQKVDVKTAKGFNEMSEQEVTEFITANSHVLKEVGIGSG